jgi:predicted transcriptional regulator
VPQSTIGRIEAGAVDPRVHTLSSLLRACGFDLEVEQLLGEGVDRSQIRQLLSFTPDERIERTLAGARFLRSMRGAVRSTASSRT